MSAYRITRIVATAELGCHLSLERILNDCELARPTRCFSGITLRSDSRSHCRVHANGKIIVNGCTTTEDARKLAEVYCNIITALGFPDAAIQNYKVVNIVACVDFKKRICLTSLAKRMEPYARNVKYNQEFFSGMSAELSEATCTVFHTGKCNILGAKDLEDIEATLLELNIVAGLFVF